MILSEKFFIITKILDSEIRISNIQNVMFESIRFCQTILEIKDLGLVLIRLASY